MQPGQDYQGGAWSVRSRWGSGPWGRHVPRLVGLQADGGADGPRSGDSACPEGGRFPRPRPGEDNTRAQRGLTKRTWVTVSPVVSPLASSGTNDPACRRLPLKSEHWGVDQAGGSRRGECGERPSTPPAFR